MDETKSAITPTEPVRPMTSQPWKATGLPKTTWYKARKAGLTPLPVDIGLPTALPLYRTSDLLAWVAALPAGKIRTGFRGGRRRKADTQPAA